MHSAVSQGAVYAFKGQSIYYDFFNSNSTHAVGFGLYYRPTLTSTEAEEKLVPNSVLTAGYGNGNNGKIIQAPWDGYYFERASCGGSGQTGCNGSGNTTAPW